MSMNLSFSTQDIKWEMRISIFNFELTNHELY